MSIFDLFRGFFGVPGGHYGRYGPREPFFDSMTHDDEEEDEDDDACYSGSFGGPGERDPFDDSWRFGFSMGPNGMRLHEPAMFGQILRDMEEIFAELGRFDDSRHGHFGLPPLEPPPPQGRGPRGLEPGGSSDGSCLRDSMLKGPEDRGPRPPAGPPPPSGPPPPGSQRSPPLPSSPFGHWSSPFSRFHEGFRDRLFSAPQNDRKEDGDLDSQVSSGGLDQILTPAQPAPAPAPSQPRIRSFFQSVTVKKVVKPDGSVEETRTVRDGQGNEETTVTRSGGSGHPEDANGPGPLLPGGLGPFDMQDDTSLFSRFFGGFRG